MNFDTTYRSIHAGVEGTVYAMENACLQQGQSLGSSPLEGCVVTCRAHGWRYNLTTGNTLHVPDYGVQTYPVTVVGGKIMIALVTPPPATGKADTPGRTARS